MEDTIAELFRRDKEQLLNMPKADLERIIEYFRAARQTFKQTGKAQTSVKREVSLDDLGL